MRLSEHVQSFTALKKPVESVANATQTVLGVWQKYGDKTEGLSVVVGSAAFWLSRQGEKILVEGIAVQDKLVLDSDFPETVVRLVEGVKFPASVTVRVFGTHDPRDVPTNMHAVWLQAPTHVTRATSQAWAPYLDYARRVKLHTMASIHTNNTHLNALRKHQNSYNSPWGRWALVNQKNGAVIGHAVVDEPSAGEDMSLVRLFVDPDQRRRGGAGVLVRAVEQRARDVQAKGIAIDSSMEGQSFYRGEGYRNRGGYQFYKRARNFR